MQSSSSRKEIINDLLPDQRFKTVIFLVTVIAFIECYAQYNLRKGKLTNNDNCIIISAILYGFVCFLLFKTYHYDGMGHINLIWSCISILLAYIVGVFIFKEHINKYGIIAIMFALLAIYFSHLNDENPSIQ
jgi:multidrug transporter EmrE-like cation transporter